MGTAAWVCFDCRSAVRRHTQYEGDVPCPNCGSLCTYLGYKIPVPPKRKRREWTALYAQLMREKTGREMAAYLARDHARTVLEREIDRLEAQGAESWTCLDDPAFATEARLARCLSRHARQMEGG